MKNLLVRMLTALFPRRCRICGDVVEFDRDVCENCINLPEIAPPLCLKCGHTKSDCICKNHNRSVEYKAVIAPFYYEGRIQQGILNFKMHSMPFLADGYGIIIADTVKKYYERIEFDYVTYIPMRRNDERNREFNQAKLLAKIVSDESKIPFADLLVKSIKTKKQKMQSAKERFVNMYGAFDIAKDADVTGRTILLIDDVKTTGATLSSAALVLKAHGAKKVYCAVFAIVK